MQRAATRHPAAVTTSDAPVFALTAKSGQRDHPRQGEVGVRGRALDAVTITGMSTVAASQNSAPT